LIAVKLYFPVPLPLAEVTVVWQFLQVKIMQIAKLEEIEKLLPHGKKAIGITSVLECIPNRIVATARIGHSRLLLDTAGFLIPEAMLELIGQAAAIGGNLVSRNLDDAGKAKQGVIARVRSFWVQRDRTYSEMEELVVTVTWSEPVGKVFELEGDVRISGSDNIVAKADCTVLEIA